MRNTPLKDMPNVCPKGVAMLPAVRRAQRHGFMHRGKFMRRGKVTCAPRALPLPAATHATATSKTAHSTVLHATCRFTPVASQLRCKLRLGTLLQRLAIARRESNKVSDCVRLVHEPTLRHVTANRGRVSSRHAHILTTRHTPHATHEAHRS